MNKKSKFIIILITINILATMIIGSVQNTIYAATTQNVSTDINSINNTKYPGVKSMIQSLQKSHPNWKFKVIYTGLDWDDVIKGEYVHGKNLVQSGQKNYSGDWICSTCINKEKAYEGGSWLCASDSAIKYMMDPRNSLYYADIFQFLELSYDETMTYDASIIKAILEDSFLDDGNLDTYINTIMVESKNYGINPYYIAAKAIQEQGKNGGSTFKMQDTSVTSKKVYYYNIFNIGATGSTTNAIVANALSKAKAKGWNSIEKCIIGGIEFIVDGYINEGQDTMYFEKFNVVNPNYYVHQYAGDVMYAENQAIRLRKALEEVGATEYAYTFIIPLYENMPNTVCARPSITTTTTLPVEIKDNMKIDNNNKTITTVPGMKISDVLNTISSTDKVKDEKGKECTDTSEAIGTGYTIGSKYTIAVVGDANSDGKINSGDLFSVQKYLLNKNDLSDVMKIAMDANNDSKINSGDLFRIQKYLLGTEFEIE